MVFALAFPQPAQAHPADEVAERAIVRIEPDAIALDITLSAGALTLRTIWQDADTNGDRSVDDGERQTFGQRLADATVLRVDNTPAPVSYVPDSLIIASSFRAFELQGADESGATVSARFRAPRTATTTVQDVTLSLHHYGATRGGRPADVYAETAQPFTIVIQGGSDVDLRMTIAPADYRPTLPVPAPARDPNGPAVRRLVRFVGQSAPGPGTIPLGIGIAALFGALHALTPGHGKTLVGAYLLGTEARIRDAVMLGGIVTLTHTGSVIVLGVLAVILTGVLAPVAVVQWLTLLSSGAILGLGLTLFITRLRSARTMRHRGTRRTAPQTRSTEPGTEEHEHEDGTVHSHGWFGDAAHTHHTAARATPRALLALGISGGAVPCPDALAILLIALAAGHVLFGILIILGFSLGLGAVLIALGLALTSSRLRRVCGTRLPQSTRISHWLPTASAAMMVTVAVVAFTRAVAVFV